MKIGRWIRLIRLAKMCGGGGGGAQKKVAFTKDRSMWRSEFLVCKYRSAQADEGAHPLRIQFVLQPQLSFSNFGRPMRQEFTIHGAPHTTHAYLYAHDWWEHNDGFVHANGNAIAFTFTAGATSAELRTARVTDKARWRQLFIIQNMDGAIVADAAGAMHSEFLPPQTLLFPNATNLDRHGISFTNGSALIAFDGYTRTTPNAVYRCVYRITIEGNHPPSVAVSTGGSGTRGGPTDDSTAVNYDHEANPRHLSPGHTELDSGRTETDEQFDPDHQGLDGFPIDDRSSSPQSSEHPASPILSIGDPYEQDAPAPMHSGLSLGRDGGNGAASSDVRGNLDAYGMGHDSGSPDVLHSDSDDDDTSLPTPPPPTTPPPPPSSAAGSSDGFQLKKRKRPTEIRTVRNRCRRSSCCTFENGHQGFCNAQGRCPGRYCGKLRGHDGPCHTMDAAEEEDDFW